MGRYTDEIWKTQKVTPKLAWVVSKIFETYTHSMHILDPRHFEVQSNRLHHNYEAE